MVTQKQQWWEADAKGKNWKSQNPVRSLYRLQNETSEIPAYTSIDMKNILCEFRNLESPGPEKYSCQVASGICNITAVSFLFSIQH